MFGANDKSPSSLAELWATNFGNAGGLRLLDPSNLIICSANEARLLQIPEVDHFSCPVVPAILLNNPALIYVSKSGTDFTPG